MNENFNDLNLYGDVEETSGGPSWTGEVDGYSMTEFFVNDNRSLEIHFLKPNPNFETQRPIKMWINAVDPEKVTVWEGKTLEQCLKSEITKQNRLIKNLALNFVEQDVYEAAFKEFKPSGSLEDQFVAFVNKVKELLPANYADTTGRLVVGYNAKGYLTCPKTMFWNEETQRYMPFFSVDPEVELQPLPSKLSRTKPVPQETVAAADVDDDF